MRRVRLLLQKKLVLIDGWSQYKGDEIVTMIQKRAHSGGKEDEAKTYKILGWKDEVIKSRVG